MSFENSVQIMLLVLLIYFSIPLFLILRRIRDKKTNVSASLEKKKQVALIAYISFGFAIFFIMNLVVPQNVLGYYRNIEDARNDSVSYYCEGNILHSETTPSRVVDFVIKDNKLHVITFKCKDTLLGSKYAYDSTSISSSLDDLCAIQARKFEENKKIPWHEVRSPLIFQAKDTVTVYWSLLPASYDIDDSDIKKHLIDAESAPFILHIKVEQEK